MPMNKPYPKNYTGKRQRDIKKMLGGSHNMMKVNPSKPGSRKAAAGMDARKNWIKQRIESAYGRGNSGRGARPMPNPRMRGK